MKCAREIFEKLGFNDVQKIYNGNDDLISIEYRQNPYKSGTIRLIDFQCLKEAVYIEDENPIFYLPLFKAIQQQIKELGWEE